MRGISVGFTALLTGALLIGALSVGAVGMAGCGRQAPTGAPHPPPVAALIGSDPATPADAASAARELDNRALAAGPGVASYDFDVAGDDVAAINDIERGLRLSDGRRTYFYRPREATPYLVREGDFAYAYRRGQLTGVLDAGGHLVEDDDALRIRTQAATVAMDHARVLRRDAADHEPR